VAGDGHSFDLSVLDRTVAICERRGSVAADDLAAVRSLADLVASGLGSRRALTAVPDDFVCPLTAELMEDPVRLPSSRMTVDRSSILRHLLDVGMDPFTRTPLTPDQLVDDAELAARITAWRRTDELASEGAAPASEGTGDGGGRGGGELPQ